MGSYSQLCRNTFHSRLHHPAVNVTIEDIKTATKIALFIKHPFIEYSLKTFPVNNQD